MSEQPDRLLSSVVSAMVACVAEVERLRAALESIANAEGLGLLSLRDIARAALAPQETQP